MITGLRENIAVFIAFFILFASFAAQADTYSVTTTPAWVSAVSIPSGNKLSQTKNSNGVEYLLVDEQIQIGNGVRQNYFHYVSKALNTSGVEDLSHISIEFDPSYETVKLHKIVIYRNGQAINMLERTKIDVIQREKDLEYQIYDGAKTLNMFIEDVRSEDSIEYSYTIEGDNPIYAGHFSRYMAMEWGVPVARAHYRVLWPSSSRLFIRNHMTGIKPEKTVHDGYTEYVWKSDRIAEKIKDQVTPKWYDPFKSVHVSDMENWAEVVEWARPLYETGALTPAQREIIDNILSNSDTVEQKILPALQFVQNEVRYLGIEVGPRSHKPNPPEVVLRQRFGDCKDKSLLLVSLLRGMSVEAYPVLVNTGLDRRIKDLQPTPRAFNHVIVQVHVGKKHYWLDPTRTYQAGTLQTLYQPDYGYGLVISDNSTDLEDMSNADGYLNIKVVDETFDVSDPSSVKSSYKITSQYDGYYADDTRRYLSETNHDEVQQGYLNYLARTYPDIDVASKMSVDDDRKNNRVVTTEEYQVRNIWKETDGKRYIFIEFVPFLIADNISSVKAPIRTMPYAISHPVLFRHTTRILLPEESEFENELDVVEDNAFRFSRKVDFNNNVLVIDYIYESLNDHVSPKEIAQYSRNLNKVDDLTYYQIHMPNPAVNFGEYRFKPDDVNWVMVVVTMAAFVIFFVLLGKYIYRYDPDYVVPENIDPSLNGIRGWLLLPAFGIIVSPIRLVADSGSLLYIFSATQWSILVDRFDGVGPLIIIAGEIVANIGLLVMSIYLIFMLFQKRNTFPRFFIVYMIAGFIIVLSDTLALQYIFENMDQTEASNIRELVQIGMSTIIWGSYFVLSKRVKATFTQRREKSIATG